MKKSEFERYKRYISRFMDKKIPARQKWVAFWRYFAMALKLIPERIRGLDYEVIYNEDNPAEDCGQYTMSPQKVLKKYSMILKI